MGVMTCHPGEIPSGVIYTAMESAVRGTSRNGMRSGVTGVTWVVGSFMTPINF